MFGVGSIKTAIVIPAKNESASIAGVLADIHKNTGLPVILVDDGSTDQTACIAKAAGASVLAHCESKGAWIAMQTGMRYAWRQGYRRVITMDADGQHLAGEIAKLREVEAKAQVIVGASSLRGGLLRQFARALFRRIGGLSVRDLTSGFRLYNAEALMLLVSSRASYLEYQDVGVLLFIKSAGLSVYEVEVEMNERADGKSRIFSSWFKVGYYMASTLLLSFAKSMPDKNARRVTAEDEK
ncbi:glycosyltransferase family 2 protein [Bowmanella denitrificans]|uniref:Glycosyltransferase family 2 protein n=1 Tax=Bowmanella denitrificans TaxID=366582 RepID=A0ABP3GSU4_9ALTE